MDEGYDDGGPVPQTDVGGELVKERFFKFLDTFSSGLEPMPAPGPMSAMGELDGVGGEDFILDGRPLLDYHAQIHAMVEAVTSTLHVDFTHVMLADMELAEAIEVEYYRFDPFLRRALQGLVARDHSVYVNGADSDKRREFYVGFYNIPRIERVRQLKTERIGRLVAVGGTVTRTSDVRPELVVGAFTCAKCGLAAEPVEQQFEYTEPTVCRNPTCNSARPWELDVQRSRFVDWQRLRVQENADEIPPGSMPRSVDVVLRADTVERAKAGDKVVFTGTLIVLPDMGLGARAGEAAVGTGAPGKRGEGFDGGVGGFRKLGVKELTYRMAFLACSALPADQLSGGVHNIRADDTEGGGVEAVEAAADFSAEEKAAIENMARTPNIYEKMVNSIAPTVFGHSEVKRGVLLMLLGGVHKQTPEGMKLRGDLNVCIVGDPSTAKSQFLKYVHGFLPRAVFASGKASSAAGLTASVVRDHETGEFCIEAGALMLADNGICCIDEGGAEGSDCGERVAIHEAMEQQTISITKAGIQATLNARTSILAAANPLFGRYDRSKTLKANVQISAPIMSRFDLFFVVLDECEEAADYAIAQHILRVHQGRREAIAPPFSKEQLQRYIRYARLYNPQIGNAGRAAMVECYRALRQNDCLGRGRTAYRITVRQLESMVRLSEALARLHLDNEVRPKYVKEAYRLLRKSIIHVESEDIVLGDDSDDDDGGNDGGGGGGDGSDGGGSDRGRGGGTNVAGVEGEGERDNLDDAEILRETQDSTRRQEARAARRHEGSDPTAGETPLEPESASQSNGGVSGDVDGGGAAEVANGGDGAGAGGGSGSGGGGRKRKHKKRRQITFELYQTITNTIATYLRQMEDATPTGQAFRGARWGDVVDWFVRQNETEYATPNDADEARRLANQVVNRLVTKDLIFFY
ncbi:unnamed protein product, partial [Phaeothamnion confervicola]